MGLPNRGFRKGGIAKINFSWKSFSMNFRVDFCTLSEALGAVFLILGALNTDLKIHGFLVMSRILSSGFGDADLVPIGALKRDNSTA